MLFLISRLGQDPLQVFDVLRHFYCFEELGFAISGSFVIIIFLNFFTLDELLDDAIIQLISLNSPLEFAAVNNLFTSGSHITLDDQHGINHTF